MRVGIAAYLLHQGADYRSAGVSTYLRELLRHLPAVSRHTEFLSFQGRDAPRLPGVKAIAAPLSTADPRARIPWEQLALPLLIQLNKVNLLHAGVNVLPLVSPARSVVTVHDLSFVRHAQRHSAQRGAYLRWMVPRSVRRASHVIAVSQHTREELVSVYGTSPDKVTVVHNGVDQRFRPLSSEELQQFRARSGLAGPYILHVGTLEPRKNLDVLIKAFARCRADDHLPHSLVLVGARGWMEEQLFSLVLELGLRNAVRFIEYVSPDELPLWYNCADLFAYPSVYEGFGLPMLEAMACGVPCVTTASSALLEVSGGATLTVEPNDVDALQAGLSRMLGDEGLRSRLSGLGVRRAREFSWEKTARETMQVYQQVMA